MVKNSKTSWVEIIIILLIIIAGMVSTYFFVTNFKTADYIVETNAFFAPFEFYDGGEIKGVDIDIINKVATKMGKTIDIKNVEFDVIIDNVENGKIADAGAAGLTITDARKAKVDFSIPYYSSTQYVISRYEGEIQPSVITTWSKLKNQKLGSQTGSTGFLFAQDEIINGSLQNSSTILKGFESHQLAADAILSHIIDFAIADELVAKMIVAKNPQLIAEPLYYYDNDGAKIVQEEYAIAINKNRPELLEAFNEVLAEMLVKDQDGLSEIDHLVLKYTGF